MVYAFLSTASKESILSLIGSIMCSSGIGTLAVWSNINVYVFSFFYLTNKNLQYQSFNLVISLAALISALFAIISMKVAKIIGVKTLIRLTMIIYPISIIISSYTLNVKIFSLFYSIIPGVCAGLGLVPLLYCIFNHFGKDNSGHIIGIEMGFFGLSTVAFILITTFIINPDNIISNIVYKPGIIIFGPEVAQNVPQGIFIMGVVIFCLMVPGSFMINEKTENNQNDLKQNQKLIEMETQDKENNISNLTFDKKNNNNIQNFDDKKNQIKEEFSIKKYLYNKQFLLLFMTSLNVSLQIFFLSLNFKMYGMQKINDDYYLMKTLIISQFIASGSKFIWGSMVSVYPFKMVLGLSLFFGGGFTMTFPLVASNKLLFLIWYTVITICERGFLTVGPVILVILFGVEHGTNLIPFYQIGFLLGLIIVPAFQIILQTFFSFDVIFFISGAFVVLTNIYVYKMEDNKNYN